MKKYLKHFYLVSLLFLIIYLIRIDILHWPIITSGTYLFVSLTLLFAGFLADALAWYIFLQRANIHTTYRDALISSGLSIFGKYIPGKLWIVLGKAGYIATRMNLPAETVTIHALKCQFVSLWVACIVASSLFLWEDVLLVYAIPMVLFFVFLSLLIFSDFFQKLFLRFVKLFSKKEILLPVISWSDMLRVIPAYIANWLLWTFSFYFCLLSLGLSDIPFYVALSFSLAAIVGIIALFSPGGLGVREGVIAIILIGAGLSHERAATTAVSSRLWFLGGEMFIFVLAVMLKLSYAKRG
jgi:glycosyltransferase 2 family protein